MLYLGGEIMDLSVIIPAYNEENNISDCLYSVLDQEGDFEFEVVVVDDGSEDNTGKIINSYDSEKLKIIKNKENKGYSFTLNHALDHATGDIVVCVDADCVMTMNSLARVHLKFQKGADAFFGQVWVRNEGLHPTFARVAKIERDKFSYGGAFMAFKKDLLIESGGFSTEGGGWSGTDDEIKARGEELGWNVVYGRDASVKSDFPTGLDAFKNKWNSGITYVRAKQKHPQGFDLKVPLSVGYISLLWGSGLMAPFSHFFLSVFTILLTLGFLIHTKKAIKMAHYGKCRYLFLYYFYGFASDTIRAAGLLTVLKPMIKLTFRELFGQ